MNVCERAPVMRTGWFRVSARRLLLVALTVFTTVIATEHGSSILQRNGMSALEWCMLLLFVLLFAHLAFAFWMAMFGFVVKLMGGDPLAITQLLPRRKAGERLRTRSAIVMPVHNEDP